MAAAPQLYIIAGPNGAGKTTFAREFLPQFARCSEFVNADLIAQGLSPFAPESVAIRAGRIMLERIAELSARRADFAFETTLSGRGYAPLLRRLKTVGYEVHLFFLWVPTVGMSLDRVASRVRAGGHNIPEPVVRRRHGLSIRNLFHLYLPLLDSWTLFDNSGREPYAIAAGQHGRIKLLDEEAFRRCCPDQQIIVPTELKEVAEAPHWWPALQALRQAVSKVVEEHCRSGRPLVVWKDGRVYHQPPEEARREIEAARASGEFYLPPKPR